MQRKTKIICTIGPISSNEKTIADLINAGMNVARLNFSHGSQESHLENIKLLRRVSDKTKTNIGILVDTKGPEIRTGYFENGEASFKAGEKVIICPDDILGNSQKFQINCQQLFTDIKENDYILIDDGKMRFDVIKKEGSNITCLVHHDGILKDRKSCNVPGSSIKIPFLSEKDRSDIKFSCENNIDIIALSFVRNKDDVLEVKKLVDKYSKNKIEIVAKIESQEGVQNLREILEVADGVMVARGDLGVEVSLQLVPKYQKQIIKIANEMGRPVITATHMLESMINNPRPTRAEASDVANAILDGSDAIMLSGETAVGQFPIDAVNTMATIASEIEKMIEYDINLEKSSRTSENTVNDAIGIAVSQSSLTLPQVQAVIAFTETGGTAKRICKFRPSVPVIAVTNSIESSRRLSYYWGVFPVVNNNIDNSLKFDDVAIKVSKQFGIPSGSTIIITSGHGQAHGKTNTMRFIEIP